MNLLRSPRNKLLLASAAILLLALIAPTKELDAAAISRIVLAGVCIAGIAWWFLRRRAFADELAPPPRLRVLSRAGLSQRCGMALVEADGRNYLVVFGDGFAELKEAPATGAVQSAGGAR
ncbi:MAG: flagellar biosynthetic protein FliO [Myxococcaceae bacterium]